jgi:pyruvate kinase
LSDFSFVRRPSDVVALQERLAALGRRDLGVVLKIKTREAFENLPALLLSAMRRPIVGVMIARGDLAVECGWEAHPAGDGACASAQPAR